MRCLVRMTLEYSSHWQFCRTDTKWTIHHLRMMRSSLDLHWIPIKTMWKVKRNPFLPDSLHGERCWKASLAKTQNLLHLELILSLVLHIMHIFFTASSGTVHALSTCILENLHTMKSAMKDESDISDTSMKTFQYSPAQYQKTVLRNRIPQDHIGVIHLDS